MFEPSFPGRASRDRTARRPRGFALLLVVVVLGFLALIVVSLATHLHIEQTILLRQVQRDQARRHALVGLSLALGQLQAAAGPDIRSMAGASMRVGVVPNKTHWLGVWSPEQVGPTWLVSSAGANPPDPAVAATPGEAVVLVGAASAEITGTAANDPDQVVAETIPLTIPAALLSGWSGPADATVGRTAYWVGDEAGKLAVVVPDERSPVTGAAPPDPWPQMDLTSLWNGFDLQASAFQAPLAKVLFYGQLGYVDSTAFSGARLRRNFHRTTVTSRSVLSDPVNGGLRQVAAVNAGEAGAGSGGVSHDSAVFLANPPAGTDPDRLPAPRFSVYRPGGMTPSVEELTGPRAPAHLLLSGGFNLNAVSDDPLVQRERWRAVLAAARTLRFPGNTERTLASGELDALAAQMTAARFRAAYPDAGKGAFAPFGSVGQFASSGLVQAALDAALINEGRTADAPDRIEQADLLALLAPILLVRSDTFLVRAYGEVRDPIRSQPVGEAWCEALVQRLPDYVDPADEPWEAAVAADNRALGRKVVVVAFRWLTAADL